ALTERAASVSQSKQLLRVQLSCSRVRRAQCRLSARLEDIDGAASTHRALWLLCVQPSIGGADRDPFHVPGAGAASCRRSNFGPAIACSGARFVNPGSPLRQAHPPSETGTASIWPPPARSDSLPA